MVATKKTASTVTNPLNIPDLDTDTIRLTIVGRTPLIINRLSNKAKQELLLPKGRKTASEKAAGLKHNPEQEFRDSIYRDRNPEAPTLLVLPSTTIKQAMGLAVLRAGRDSGLSKTEFLQLTWVEGMNIPIYGIPKLFMAITRSADMNKTPDVRTRAIVDGWAADIDITFIRPKVHGKAIAQLAYNAGLLSGLGDWRPEKGSGSFGQFTVVEHDNPIAVKLRETGGREAQIEAMELAETYDEDSAELMSWFDEELVKRGRSTNDK